MNPKTAMILGILMTTHAALAQVGIGTSTPHASAQLEVKATSKGVLLPRVALTGLDDASTISSPAAGLVVYNTGNAGTGANAVTKGVYNYDGTAWKPMNNVVTPDPTLPVVGTIGGFQTFGIDGLGFWGQAQNSYYDDDTGLSVTLPPGKWQVKIGVRIVGGDFLNGYAGEPALSGTRPSWSHRFYLKDSATALSGPRWYSTYKELDSTGSAYITGDTISGMASAVEKEHNLMEVQGNSSRVLFVEGSIWINNSGATSKTYYLFHTELMSPVILNYANNLVANEPQSIYYGTTPLSPDSGIGGPGRGANYIVAYPHPTQ